MELKQGIQATQLLAGSVCHREYQPGLFCTFQLGAKLVALLALEAGQQRFRARRQLEVGSL